MSQAGIINNSGGGGGDVTSVTGINGVTTSPTTGAILASLTLPNSYLHEFDDFIESQGIGQGGTKLNWYIQSATVFNSPGTSTNPGILIASNSGSGANVSILFKQTDASNNQIGPFALGGGAFNTNWVCKLPVLSSPGNTYRFSCGLADAQTIYNTSALGTDAFINGVYFQYTDSVNSGNYTIKCTNTSTTTTTNTSTAATTSFVNLGISVNALASSVTFTINGVNVGTITTNIPTASLTPFLLAFNLSGSTPDLWADLYYMSNSLTIAR